MGDLKSKISPYLYGAKQIMSQVNSAADRFLDKQQDFADYRKSLGIYNDEEKEAAKLAAIEQTQEELSNLDWNSEDAEDIYRSFASPEDVRTMEIAKGIGTTVATLPFTAGTMGWVPALTTTATGLGGGYAGAYGGQKLGQWIDNKYGWNTTPWLSTIGGIGGGILGGGLGYKGMLNTISKMTKMPQNRTLFSQSFVDDAIAQKIKKLPYTTDQLDEMYDQYVKEGIISENYGDYYARDYFGVKPTTQIDKELRDKLRAYYWGKNNHVDMDLDPFKDRSPFIPSYSPEGRRYVASQIKKVKDALSYAKRMKSKRGLTTEPYPNDLTNQYLSKDGVLDIYEMSKAIEKGWDFKIEPKLRFLPIDPKDATRDATYMTLGYPVKTQLGKSNFTPGAAAIHEHFHGRKLFNSNTNLINSESPFYGMDYSKVPLRWKQLLGSKTSDKHLFELAEGYSDLNATKYNMKAITDAAINPRTNYTYWDLIRYKLTPKGMTDRFIQQRGGWWRGWKQQLDALNEVYKNGGKL